VNKLLVIAIKLNDVKLVRIAAIVLFQILQEYYLNKSAHFSCTTTAPKSGASVAAKVLAAKVLAAKVLKFARPAF
jgi:hypothetical protein